ncbi:hypothetical protein ACQ4PT_059072 [Festuca glaucescens]
MVVVMASGNQTSMPPKLRSAAMNYRLLAAACSGSFQDLELLLRGEGHQGSSADDEEAFLRESLLGGVTLGGDTALHVVAGATIGDGDDILRKAGLIHAKAQDILLVRNNNGDTALHCAARAANIQMVSLLIDLAKGRDDNASRVKALLEIENQTRETALHEAVRMGNNDIVKLLMEENAQLATLPNDGTSPLYLAILLENKIMAKTLYELSGGVLAYSGTNGQNALHAAVLRGKDLTNMLLEWNNNLTLQRDEDGSTPLHFAAVGVQGQGLRDIHIIRSQVLKANPDALYQPDNNGSFPIHMAASVGATAAIIEFLKKSPSCAGLRDARERTFLHVAVDKMEIRTVSYACTNQSLSWILNMKDIDGNTALHLAVQAKSLRMFCSLFGNRQVHLNLTNKKGETPLDIALHNIPEGLYDSQITEAMILQPLRITGAKMGICRKNYFKENDTVQARQDEIHEMEKVKDATQSICIGSVLIATVTFGAAFAMPGGYRADDHTNGGTPTLAGRYGFDAFTLANALAFTCSTMATISLMASGSPIRHPPSRTQHFRVAYYLMSVAVTSLVAAFAFGTYMMLAPVSHKTAIGVCVLSSLILVYQKMEGAIRIITMSAALCRRKGIVWIFLCASSFVCSLPFEYWPITVIVCLTAINYDRHN